MNSINSISITAREEIGYDGLEGITLEALWTRISERIQQPLPFPSRFCNRIFQSILKMSDMQFFELPEPRLKLVIQKRLPNNASQIETEVCPTKIYKYNPISLYNLKGSCEDYFERKAIPREELVNKTVEEVESQWNTKLVIVASQVFRESLLIPGNICCSLELTLVQYCVLEKIGRARTNGETSQGVGSLLEFFSDIKLSHHDKKALTGSKLIITQPYIQKQISGQYVSSHLLHLPQFYVEMKSKQMRSIEKLMEYLKIKTNYMSDYEDIRNYLGITKSVFKKLIRHSEFPKYFSIDVAPYRSIYPDATPAEYKLKQRDEEKILKVAILKDPNLDIYKMWDKDDFEEENSVFLSLANQVFDTEILRQAYQAIKMAKSVGMSQFELGRYLGLSKLNSRSVCKNLEKMGLITSYVKDEGRQRANKFIVLQYLGKQQDIESETNIFNTLVNNTMNSMNSSELDATLPTSAENEENEQPNVADDLCDTVMTDVKQEINVVQSISGFKIEPCGISNLMKNNKLCLRMVNRCNSIIKAVQTSKVIALPEILSSIIVREKEEGYKERICKKSLIRLVGRLSSDKLLKLIAVKLFHNTRQKNIYFCCDSSIKISDEIFKEKIRNVKLKYFNEGSYVKKQTPAIEIGSILKQFGPCPKFMRMQLMHEFLFYLLHMEAGTIIQTNDAINEWKTLLPPTVDTSEMEKEFAYVYSSALDWKMFVPRLIKQQNYPKGFMLLSDVILRLPLSILVKLSPLQLNEANDEINEYLSHPIRQHYLLNKLPDSIRNTVMYKRKYIFAVEEVTRRLCYAGLLQFGPKHSNVKDQVYIYLNKNAALVDTSSSEPGYHHISNYKVYDKTMYKFEKSEDLHTYWTDLMNICLNTKLNRRSYVDGKEILIEQMESKPALIEQAKSKEVAFILANDKGVTPGDQLGAAGLDSTFFAHLKSNWIKKFNVRAVSNPVTKPKKNVVPSIPRRTFKNLLMERSKKSNRNEKVNKKHYVPPASSKLTINKLKSKQYIRKVVMRPNAGKKRMYDDVDREALKLMQKLRCEWTTAEDNMLLLCRVGFRYFFGNRKRLLAPTIIRDIMHWKNKKLSLNKTSKACQRRIPYILKSEATVSIFNICYEEVKNDYDFLKKFGLNFVENLKKKYEKDNINFIKALKIHFVNFIYILSQKFPNLKLSSTPSMSQSNRKLIIPNTIHNYELLFNEKVTDSNLINMYMEVDGSNALDVNLLTILIHSSMCSVKDKTSWNLQFFSIFKNYPNLVVMEALNFLRKNQVISINKASKSKIDPNKIMQLYSQPFHLSNRYIQQLQTKIVYSTQNEYFMELKKLLNSKNNFDLSACNTGNVFLLIEFLCFDLITIRIETPKNVITLDKTRKTESTMYEKIFDRFQEIYTVISKTDNIGEPSGDSKRAETSSQPKRKKVQFNDHTDCVQYKYQVAEKLAKLQDFELHFFCLMRNLNNTIVQAVKINEDNVCSLPQCVCATVETEPIAGPSTASDPIISENIYEECEKILNENKNEIKDMSRNINTISAPNQVVNKKITSENLHQLYHQLIDTHFTANETLNKKDFGKLRPDFANSNSKSNVWEIVDDICELTSDDIEDDWLTKFTRNSIDNFMHTDDDTDFSIPKISDLRSLNSNDVTEKIRRLHEFFVVNSSKLNVVLNEDKTKAANCVQMEDVAVPKVIVPDIVNVKATILKRITNDLQWTITKNSDESVAEIIKSENSSVDEQNALIELLIFIEQFREVGATVTDLKLLNNKYTLEKHLLYLAQKKFLLKTGVTTITFVHWKYAMLWTVTSFHILRKDKEAMSTEDAVKESLKRKHADEDEEDSSTASKMMALDDGPSTSSAAQNNEKSTPSYVMRNQETIQLCPYTWNRVNGTLNRRVLDRLLGTILFYVASNPGVKVLKIFNRFNFMPPVHLNYLLEILVELGCIACLVIPQSKPSLFSKYQTTKIEKATIFDEPENVFVEQLNGSLTKLSLFMGNKKYKAEFI